jgi:hypothetical protein
MTRLIAGLPATLITSSTISSLTPRLCVRPDPRPTDGGRPTLSRHPGDLCAPARARPLAVCGRSPTAVRRSSRRTRIGRGGTVGRVLPGCGRPRVRGRSRHGDRGRRRGGGKPLRAAARWAGAWSVSLRTGVEATASRLRTPRWTNRARAEGSAAGSRRPRWRTRVARVSTSSRSAHSSRTTSNGTPNTRRSSPPATATPELTTTSGG